MNYRFRTQLALVGMLSVLAAPVLAEDAKINPIMTKELTGLKGKEAMMLTVEYPPGGSSSEHKHNAHTFVYVLEGSIVMQVKGGQAVTLSPGQTFYEAPSDVHTVSKNASDTQPAKFLVFFVKDKGAPLLVPAQQPKWSSIGIWQSGADNEEANKGTQLKNVFAQGVLVIVVTTSETPAWPL